MTTVRIGCGAGYAGDRIDPAVELAEHGDLDYLVFECLAERTIALAQQAMAHDPDAGFDPLLVARMRAVLPACAARGTRIVTNMGAANPRAAAASVCAVARELGLEGLKVGVVTGDDVLAYVRAHDSLDVDEGGCVRDLSDRLVSANAYIGAVAIVEALAAGANVIVTGRAADPSLFLGPLVHAFGWRMDDWPLLGCGTVAGHLLECAGQVTGGYFADPGRKDVDGLARLGFPLAEVDAHGRLVVTKVAGSGGRVSAATCKEQLLYEIHDPAAYATPDVVADISGVTVEEIGIDRVEVRGATGRARPATLKVSLGYRDGFIGEGQISYAGPGAVARARLAIDILRERLRMFGIHDADLRADLIGIDALSGTSGAEQGGAREVRVRIAGRARTRDAARRIGSEVEALYTNGPAGGGGAVTSTREVLAVASTFVPREAVTTRVVIEEVS